MSTLQSVKGDQRPLSKQRQQVLDGHKAGLTPRQIAAALGVSTQRIHQQLGKLREAGLIEVSA